MCTHLFASEHQAGLDCRLEACTAGKTHPRSRQGYGMDEPCQCSTNMLVILGIKLACTFTSEQQSTPAAEEDGVSVTVRQGTAVLHR